MREHSIRLRIRQMRKAAGMNQGELAKAAGIKQAMLSKYENSENLPSLSAIVRIADALCCTVDELIWRPDMTRIRLERMREAKEKTDKNEEAWRKAHELD